MIKKNIKTLVTTSIIILIPILVGVILWDKLPDSMAAHWNFQGEVDRWQSKTMSVFFMPLLLLGLHWLCFLGTSMDPKRANHPPKIVTLVLWIIPVLSILLQGFVYAFSLGYDVKINFVIPLIVGVVLTIVGNYLPKCKQNYTIGIKLPWTLDSEENWNRTHRLAGHVWTIGGMLITLTSFVGYPVLLLPIMLCMLFVPTIYSYMLFRKGL